MVDFTVELLYWWVVTPPKVKKNIYNILLNYWQALLAAPEIRTQVPLIASPPLLHYLSTTLLLQLFSIVWTSNFQLFCLAKMEYEKNHLTKHVNHWPMGSDAQLA